MISVIMPAYNAEKTIEYSVRSVLAQSISDLELLIVNDGSKDSTAEIAGRIAEGDRRVKVFTIENSGPAMARNYALDRLSESADYITFIDADDVMEPDTLEYALTAAEKGAQFVMLGFSIKNLNGTRRDYFEPEQYFTSETVGQALPKLYMANMLNQVWAKLYSAPLIREKHIRFPDYRWGEDRLFNFDVLENTARSAVLPECKYLYIMQPGESLISRFYDKKLTVCCEADRRMSELCSRFGTKDDAGCRYMFIKSVFSCITTLFAPSCPLSSAEKKDYLRSVFSNEQIMRRSENMFGGTAEKLMCAVMKSKSVPLNMLLFRTVYNVGKFMPELFLVLKHKK